MIRKGTLKVPSISPDAATYSGTPLQMIYPIGSDIALGTGVNPINGDLVAPLVTGIPAPTAPTAASGTSMTNDTSYSMVSNTQAYSTAVTADATATGNTQVVNGSFSGGYFNSQTCSANSLVLAAYGINIQEIFGPGAGWDFDSDSVLVADAVISQIEANGYTAFINQNGSHFIGGIAYGNQYNASFNATFANATSQTNAQAALSAAFFAGTDSGSFSASLSTTASSQSGFASEHWNQQALGGFTPTQPANAANITNNLQNFSSAIPTPVFYLLYDWRQIPVVYDAAELFGPTFEFDDYLENLPAVQETIAQLQYIVNTCQIMLDTTNYFGMTNLSFVNNALSMANTAIDTIQGYTPAQVASFAASTFQNQLGVLPQLALISNGMINVVLSATLDGAFTPSSYAPQGFTLNTPYTTGPLGFFPAHATDSQPWLFGFVYPAFGQIQPLMGLLQSNGILDPDWSHYGTLFSWSAALPASTQTITGVGKNAATYPHLSTTVTFV